MKGMKILGTVIGIFLILGGISCVFAPNEAYFPIECVAWLSMVADAIGNIVTWHSKKKEQMADEWDLAGAIISLIFGIFMLFCGFALYIVVLWIIDKGIIRIVSSLKIRKIRKALDTQILGRNRGKVLVLDILMTICGILFLIYPRISMITIYIFVGISIISSGINLITFATAKPE